MDPSFSSCSSSTLDSIRKSGIGRRGGVKVRGGRLPPVQIHKVLTKKQAFVPKIVERKVKEKAENANVSESSEKKFIEFRNHRGGRGRGGRGRGARVYIQTEGTLFGDGPAFQIKKERDYSRFERLPRNSKTVGIKTEANTINTEAINSLLESCALETESDSDNEFKPIKFPKDQKSIVTKKEFSDSEETKLTIKEEPEDESYPKVSLETLEGKFFTRIKTEPISDSEDLGNDMKTFKRKYSDKSLYKISSDLKNEFPKDSEIAEDIKKMENGGLLMLLQFPSCLPFELCMDDSQNKNKSSTSSNLKNDSGKATEKKFVKAASIHELLDGSIGKFQVLKSGKMRFVMGSTLIYFERASTYSSSEVVSISTKGKVGDLIVVGNIDRKILLRPQISDVVN